MIEFLKSIPNFLLSLLILYLVVSTIIFIFKLKHDQTVSGPDNQSNHRFWHFTLGQTISLINLLASLLALFTFQTGMQTISPSVSTPEAITVTSYPHPSPSDLTMESLIFYEDPASVIRLKVPINWRNQSTTPDPPESTPFHPVKVLFLPNDPKQQLFAFITIYVIRVPYPQDQQKLADGLASYISKEYENLDGLRIEQPTLLNDGSAQMEWFFRISNPGVAPHLMRAVSWIRQKDRRILQLTIAVPEERYAELGPTITRIYESCVILPEQP